MEACAAEVASLVENAVFEVVERPTVKPVITSKWVFEKKRGLSGQVEKYKARLVARGFMQEEGVDYAETCSPKVRFESMPHRMKREGLPCRKFLTRLQLDP